MLLEKGLIGLKDGGGVEGLNPVICDGVVDLLSMLSMNSPRLAWF